MAIAHPPLAGPAFDALKAEVMRAAVELSDAQLLDLADGLHGLLRLRGPGRQISAPDGFLDDDPPWSG